MKLKIYMAASLVNAPVNLKIANALRQAGHEVFLPQEFCPEDIPHESYPKRISKMCLEKMEDSDVGLILLDCYGRDSAWECGWFVGRKKPLIGFVNYNLWFLKDWTIKANLKTVITANPEIEDYLRNDEILKSHSVHYIENLKYLGRKIEECYNNQHGEEERINNS